MKPFLKDLGNKCFKPAPVSNEDFLKGSVKQDLRCFKPDPALNEDFLQGFVKQDVSNQLQPQMKRFFKDLYIIRSYLLTQAELQLYGFRIENLLDFVIWAQKHP